MGHFKNKARKCRSCKATWTAHEEKTSDVNIAIQLVHRAYRDEYDVALVMTADSDLCPAIDLVAVNFPDKDIVVVTPPGRYNIAREIRAKVEVKKIKEKHLVNNLLPKDVYDNGVLVASRPSKYAP